MCARRKRRLAMIGSDGGDQGRLADLQNADPMACGYGPCPGRLRGDLGYYFSQDVGSRRVRGVLQLHHEAPAVVVANHSDEPHDGSGCLMAHQFLVFGEKNRLIRQPGAHYLASHEGPLYWRTPCDRSRSINASSPG